MSKTIPGIHHVTAIAGDPQKNVDFYVGVLGLRLVKRTVNFDDPGTYHLYYGDTVGHPGTILTFFPWPGAHKGRRGTGQVTVVSFAIPERALDYWLKRLKEHGVTVERPGMRFDETVLRFFDPDGLQLELVAQVNVETYEPWNAAPVPTDYAIRGFHSVSLTEEGYERTAALLTDTMGFRLIREEGNRFRYQTSTGGIGTLVDVVCEPDAAPGLVAVGTVHHVAWRTPDDAAQRLWHDEMAHLGLNVTPIIDRQYFHSIYFREPGGILFEIATDPPGFTIDEPIDQLGMHLKLPPWLEPQRSKLEQWLPPISVPVVSRT
jgi:glyoxalase family protein